MKVSLAKQAKHCDYYPSESEGGKGLPDTREAPSKLLSYVLSPKDGVKQFLAFPWSRPLPF